METSRAATRERFQLFFLLCVNVTICVLLIAKYRSGEITRLNAIISAAICVVFLNAVMLFALRNAAQKTGHTISRKLLVAASVLAASGFVTTLLVATHSAHHASELDLALSDTPLSSIEPARKRLLVEMLRQTAANSRENDKLLANARQHPLNPQVYTPESFANTQAMQQVVDRLTSIVQADAAYAAKQMAAKQHFRDQMATVDPAYLNRWNDSIRPQDEAQASVEKIQQDWLASVVALYTFAQQNSGEIAIKDGNVQLSPSADDAIFHQLMDQSKAQYQELLAAVQRGVNSQKAAKSRVLTP